ncbi:MAG: hypothetical protein ACFE9I_01510 [Candidatus Hermodarchaeota archaeon]
MKNYKIVGIVVLSVFFILPFFVVNAKCTTTIGDTSFPAEVGDVIVWEVLHSAGVSGDVDDMVNFTTEAIYQGQHASVNALLVNCTLGYYDAEASQWTTTYDNNFYMAANETQNYLNVSSHFMDLAILYVIPTPINLSSIALLLSRNPQVTSYEVYSDKVYLYGDKIHKLWFSSSGILTRYEGFAGGYPFFKIALPEDPEDPKGGGGAIPFGFYFLIFALISIVALVYYKKKKTHIETI